MLVRGNQPGTGEICGELIGQGTGELRLPLVEISDPTKRIVESALKGLNLI